MRETDFWSRRRAGVRKEEQAEAAARASAELRDQHAALEEQPDEDILAELNLPEPETLREGDDFSVFMAKAVPDRIRRRALRVLWKANPVLANLDELVEYGENYTDSATVVENLQTAYQIGRGMLAHVEEMTRQVNEEAEAQKAETDEHMVEASDVADDTPVMAFDKAPTPVMDVDAMEEDETHARVEELIAQAPPRRMKFRIEEAV
ncbi:MAG: DUF3306 domain-containing protein [Pseudomonadota bacterium]